jgi:MFS family permease
MSAEGSTVPASAEPEKTRTLPGARLVLTLLLTINLFNYIDRQVLSAVLPRIQDEFFPGSSKKENDADESGKPQATASPEDALVKTKMGFLTTAFIVSYMLFSPAFGVLADRISRWWLIGIGVTVWTLASGGSGLAMGFLALLLTRIFVGVGEAAYGPAAPAILSDMYPVSRRGTILAWFNAAIPVGSALGFVIGGQMLNVSEMFTGSPSWRWGFFAVVPPGLFLAIFCFFMREVPRGQSDKVRSSSAGEPSGGIMREVLQGPSEEVEVPRAASLADYGVILRTPSFVYGTLGYTALTFVLGGLASWMPFYVSVSRGQKNEAQAATVFGAIVVVAGLFSTLLGGWAGDRLRGKFPGAYLLVSGWGVLLSFPLLLAVIFVDFPYAWGFVFASVFWMFFNTGPINTVLANVTHPSVRASGFALNILIIHLFGDAISPPIIGGLADFAKYATEKRFVSGWLADALARHDGMDFSFTCTAMLLLLAGVFWLWGAQYLGEDTKNALHPVAPRQKR